jgi:hypothetical protein
MARKPVHGEDLLTTPVQIEFAPLSLSLEENTMHESTNDTMKTESASWTDAVAAGGNSVFRTVEDGMGTIGRETWNFFHHFPGHGTIVGGAVGLGAAMLVGVAELATACFTAYVSYRIFAYGESLSEAVEKAIKFEAGKLEKKERDKPIPE